MFSISEILVHPAFADTVAATAPVSDAAATGAGGGTQFMNLVPLVLIFAVFYLLVIRPQQKKMAEQDKMVKALQRGDRIITSGGIHGKIIRLEGDDLIMVEIADGVQVKMLRSHVQSLAAKTQPVEDTSSKS